MKKGVIYTSISGEYDHLRDYLVIDRDWDYICFSNTVKPGVYNGSWQIVPLKFSKLDDVRNARWHKINPHKILKDYKYSVWIDANIDVVDKEFYKEVDAHIKNKERFAVMKHPERDCIYDEAKVVVEWKIDDPTIVAKQVTKLRKDGYPKHNGLIVSSILLRDHNNKSVVDIMDDWWKWVRDYSKRDQLSLNYVLWKHKFKPTSLPFKYVGFGQSGPLFWRRHDNGWKIVQQKEQLINNQEKVIADLDYRITRLNQQITSLDRQIIDLNQRIADLYASLSWRITKPVRLLSRFIRKFMKVGV